MKNIHLISTDKPSRLHFDDKLFLSTNPQISKDINSIVEGRNIYITYTELTLAKKGDWYLKSPCYTELIRCHYDSFPNETPKVLLSKIIQTTDPDLIADGVQPIDDEFLEWFVDNPSCEMVEVKEVRQRCHLSLRDWVDEDENGEFPMSIAGAFAYRWIYKIIIPQEEPTLEEEPKEEEINMFTKGKKYIQQDGVVILAGENGTNGIVITDHKKMWGVGHYSDEWNPKAFKLLEEPKEQAKEIEKEQKGYSVEEVIDLLIKINSWPTTFEGKEDITEWFEQSKNKNNEN